MITTIARVFILLNIVFWSNADPEAEADPSPIAGILRISQHIIHRIGKSPFEKCNINADCKVDYQRCEDGYCKCPSGFTFTNDHKCDLIGGVGDDCAATPDCIPPHSSCVDQTCTCDLGYVDDGNFCFQQTSWGGECEKEIQCPNTEFYDCVDDVCVCSDTAVFVTGLGCLEILQLGDVCLEDAQCSHDFNNAECNAVCQCQTGFQLNSAEDDCVPEFITVLVVFESGDAWDANYADTGSTEYATFRTTWDAIVSAAEGVESTVLSSYTFTESTDDPGTTVISVHVVVPNPDEGTRKRRSASPRARRDAYEEEQHQSLAESEAAMNSRSVLLPTISEDELALDQFCLQTMDCGEIGKTCSDNACR